MTPHVSLTAFVSGVDASPLAPFATLEPWEITARAMDIVARLLPGAASSHFTLVDGVAVHATAILERGAVLKGPAVIGAQCFVAAGAYVRDGCWLDARCTLGPGVEIKSAFLFAGTKLAHLNFVGDSILGSDVNLEAGAIVANFRNENPNGTISIAREGSRVDTGARKFGALIGDGARIGANAVVAPGALLLPRTVVPRLGLIDQG